MAGKHYLIATQHGYLVDKITHYPYEFQFEGSCREGTLRGSEACRGGLPQEP
jgi:hypothetical protein